MRRDLMSKLSASFFVLVMALSALAVSPAAITGQAAGTNDITILVIDSDGYTVEDATVTLTNVHTGEVVEADYSSGYYVATAPPSALYRVDVTAPELYDRLDAIAGGLVFDALASEVVSPPIVLQTMPTKEHTWNVTVVDSLSRVVANAQVGFYDAERREIVAVGTTNADGYVNVDMFQVDDLLENYHLFAMKDTYAVYTEPVTVTADATPTVTLSKGKVVRGYVWDTEDGLGSNAVAYLIDHDESVPWIKRVMKSDLGGGSFVLYAYPGDFTLIVDADGLAGDMVDITIAPLDTYILNDFVLDYQTQRVEEAVMTFGSDYNSFELSVDTVWSYDEPCYGLLYSDVGSLRAQIDMNSPDTDGEVDALEAADFQDKVMDYGPQYVATERLITVNDTVFEATLASASVSVGAVEGTVDLKDAVSYSYTCDYTSVEDIDVGAEDYTSVVYARYDTPEVDRKYTVALPAGYELVDNSSDYPGSHVNMTGYETFTVDSQEWAGGPEAVELAYAKSVGPSAGAGMDDSSEFVYAVLDDEGNVTKYIVCVGEEVNFTAESSSDPNGNPLTYTWDFGDGSATLTTQELLAPHTYAAAAASLTVNLTIEDVSGAFNWTEIEVSADARDPVPVITVKDLTVNETTNTLAIDQGEVVWFNATSASDDVVAAGDGLGEIDFVEFYYGDGNESGRVYWSEDEQNVSHSYEDSGTYTLTLNVTDVVGHWKNTTMTVVVNDTELPVVSFTVRNATWGTRLIENVTLVFDANATKDNTDNNTVMTFCWNFGDDSGWTNDTGISNVTHMYERVGTFTVTLNVTDASGNSKEVTKSITVLAGPRPNVQVDKIYFDTDTFTEDKVGYIWINLTNKGSAVAESVVVSVFIVNADGTFKLVGTTSALLNGTDSVTSIEVGGTAQVKFAWTPSSKGTYKFRVNVTSDEQLVEDSMSSGEIVVEEAGWKALALWGGVAAVIILVPLLLYLRGRMSKREKKGPRRQKKSAE
jgi:PKD repeat protein